MATNTEVSPAMCKTQFQLWITICPPKMARDHPQVTIGTIYHPPGSDDWAMLNHIDQSLDYIRRQHPYTGIIIMGDFNKMKGSQLKRNHNLKQSVDLPTRGNAILDNIYTNVSNFYQRPVICASIDLSDHKAIVCIPSTSSKYTSPVVSCIPSRSHKPPHGKTCRISCNLWWLTLPLCHRTIPSSR